MHSFSGTRAATRRFPPVKVQQWRHRRSLSRTTTRTRRWTWWPSRAFETVIRAFSSFHSLSPFPHERIKFCILYTHTHTICRLSSVRQPGGPTCHREHTKTHTLWNKMLLQVLWIKILDFSELESMPRDQNNENFQRAFYTNLMWELICYTEAEHHSAVIATVCFWLFPHVNDVNY